MAVATSLQVQTTTSSSSSNASQSASQTKGRKRRLKKLSKSSLPSKKIKRARTAPSNPTSPSLDASKTVFSNNVFHIPAKSPTEGYARIMLSPPLLWSSWKDKLPSLEESASSGCFLILRGNESFHTNNPDFSLENVAKLFEKRIECFLHEESSEATSPISKQIHQLIHEQADTTDDIMRAVRRFTKVIDRFKSRGGTRRRRYFLGEDELAWFGDSKGNLQPRKLIFLRRLALPIVLKKIVLSSDGGDDDEEEGILHQDVKELDFSFLDVLIHTNAVAVEVVQQLIKKIDVIQPLLDNPLGACTTAGAKNRADSCREGNRFQFYHEMRQLLLEALVRWEGADEHPKLHREIHRRSHHKKEKSRVKLNALEGFKGDFIRAVNDQSIPNGHIQDARLTLLKDFVNHDRVGVGKVPGVHRVMDGTVIMTKNDISLDDFVRQTRLMAQVNRTLPRLIDPKRSRPMFQNLSKGLSEPTIDRLKQTFFTSDGCLNPAIASDIDIGPKHGYIRFNNHLCREKRSDLRWQVPIRLHYTSASTSMEGSSGLIVPTRQKVTSILSEQNIINSEMEQIHDLGILIGGTEDQSLHHDIARCTTAWLPDLDQKKTISGWEINRLVYNEAMAHPCAPSSVIVGMGPSQKVHLGVQSDNVQYVGSNKEKCKILGGKSDEEFKIIRESEHLVVIEIEKGCMFTGDFPHAGVRNFKLESEECQMMERLYDRIAVIDDKYPDDHYRRTQAVTDMLCRFKGLNRICRLHCSTELKYHTDMKIPRNAVGFINCKPNPPKR